MHPGFGDRREASCRELVGRAVVRTTRRSEARGNALQHDPLGHADRAEGGDLRGVEDAGVRMRQEPGLGEHPPGRLHKVRDRRCMAELGELTARDPIAPLGLITEGEERLLATRGRARSRDRQDLLDRQVGTLARARWSCEGAVVADIAAERGERDEDLARVRHHVPMTAVAQDPSGGHEHLGLRGQELRCLERRGPRSVERCAEDPGRWIQHAWSP